MTDDKREPVCAPSTVVEAVRAALQYRNNGAHYCRGCTAGTNNGWRHEVGCSIVIQHRTVDSARKALESIRPESEVRADAVRDCVKWLRDNAAAGMDWTRAAVALRRALGEDGGE